MPNFTHGRTSKTEILLGGNPPVDGQAIATGNSYVSGELDNSAEDNPEDGYGQLQYACGSAPGTGQTIEIHLLEAVDGTNYEGESTAFDIIPLENDTSTHYVSFHFQIPPGKYKVKVYQASGVSITVTANLYYTKPHSTQD